MAKRSIFCDNIWLVPSSWYEVQRASRLVNSPTFGDNLSVLFISLYLYIFYLIYIFPDFIKFFGWCSCVRVTKGSILLKAKKPLETPDWSWQGGKGSHIWKAAGKPLPLQLLHSWAGPGVCAGRPRVSSSRGAPCSRKDPKVRGGQSLHVDSISVQGCSFLARMQTMHWFLYSHLLGWVPGLGTLMRVFKHPLALSMFWCYNKMLFWGQLVGIFFCFEALWRLITFSRSLSTHNLYHSSSLRFLLPKGMGWWHRAWLLIRRLIWILLYAWICLEKARLSSLWLGGGVGGRLEAWVLTPAHPGAVTRWCLQEKRGWQRPSQKPGCTLSLHFASFST